MSPERRLAPLSGDNVGGDSRGSGLDDPEAAGVRVGGIANYSFRDPGTRSDKISLLKAS